MRNLKKFLALVLAMVMAFSLMVTANAQVVEWDDGDQADEAFITAIDVLSGMEIFRGDENGFRPGANITRAEVAALIYRLATGDVEDVRAGLYANYGNFVDVNESDWFAGYVGYCANAGYIRGTSDTTFSPYLPVTGYEVLAMILRAVGYDKNNEFYGPNWQTTVSATATQLGILTNVKSTHYGSTLHLASRRDVVADLLFQTAAYVPMVKYSVAFGYQDTGMEGGVIGEDKNPTLGKYIFGLTNRNDGVLLGNDETGEKEGTSVLGFASRPANSTDTFLKVPTAKDSAGHTLDVAMSWSAYAWAGNYPYEANYVDWTYSNGTAPSGGETIAMGHNVSFKLGTGIDLVGHRLDLWYDDGTGAVSNPGNYVFAYYDKADSKVVFADTTDLTSSDADSDDTTVDLGAAIKDAGMRVANNQKAVFNDSFGKFGPAAISDSTDTHAFAGSGVAESGIVAVNSEVAHGSAVEAYEIIDNNGDGVVDAIIALNIESSQITQSNNVNRVATIGVPVENFAGNTQTYTDTSPATGNDSLYVAGDKSSVTTKGNSNANLMFVDRVTGVIAQDALVGNSTTTLGDYVFGIRINGTTNRSTLSKAEVDEINGKATETAYYKMVKVEAGITGTVVAYDNIKGTVTLDVNGTRTTIERSDWYHTVVGWQEGELGTNAAPNTAIPQGWVTDTDYTASANGKWVEGYAHETYTFYVDYEGKYLGAERGYNNSFLYGTYLDYEQETNTGTFKYYLTGVDMSGNIKTVPVSSVWASSTATSPITSTDALRIPFRDSNSGGGNNNGVGKGNYRGFAISGTTVDPIYNDPNDSPNEYVNNMARLGIKMGMGNKNADDDINGNTVTINSTVSTTLGAATVATSGANKYLTEGTTFILVSGTGTGTLKADVYNGISDLLGTASSVQLLLNYQVIDSGTPSASQIVMSTTKDTLDSVISSGDLKVAEMTYYTESDYTYAQTGEVATQINTIILPKAAVTWSGGSSLYYVGNATYSSVNSWGTSAWKYDLYVDGMVQPTWIANDPNGSFALQNDVFLELSNTGKTANDGQPIYEAGSYDNVGGFQYGVYLYDDNADSAGGTSGAASANRDGGSTGSNYQTYAGVTNVPRWGYIVNADYIATTRDAQTAFFANGDGMTTNSLPKTGDAGVLLRVAGAKVVNLNKGTNKEVWPGITDLTTLNAAGSIDPVTGRTLKVSAVVDSSNPLVVTTIYVCYEQ